MPDGTIADVNIGFDALKEIAAEGKKDGVIVAQHGASTLADKYFSMFVGHGVGEVHLATGFQNQTYGAMRRKLYKEISEWLASECSSAAGSFAKVTDGKFTEAQALYKERKRATGPFKEKIWRMDAKARRKAFDALHKQFSFLFDQLQVKDTIGLVRELIPKVEVRMPFPKEGEGVSVGLQAHDDASLAD
jgi:hypothetical protein